MNEAPRERSGPGDHLPGVLVHRDDHDEDAVLGEDTPVPQDHRADIAYAQSVDEDIARRDLVAEMWKAVAQLDGVPVVGDDHMILADADLLGDLRMQRQVAELPVHRHEEL